MLQLQDLFMAVENLECADIGKFRVTDSVKSI